MRRGRTIPILFALLGMLMSLSTVSAAPWVMRSASDEHACCRSTQNTPDGEDHKSDDSGNCLAACCRVIGATDKVDVKPSGEEIVAMPAMTWSIVAISLPDPDSIFRPPRA